VRAPAILLQRHGLLVNQLQQRGRPAKVPRLHLTLAAPRTGQRRPLGLRLELRRLLGQLVKVPQPHLALIVQLVIQLLLLGLHPEQPQQAGQLVKAQRLRLVPA
jgi:hypothetical protein